MALETIREIYFDFSLDFHHVKRLRQIADELTWGPKATRNWSAFVHHMEAENKWLGLRLSVVWKRSSFPPIASSAHQHIAQPKNIFLHPLRLWVSFFSAFYSKKAHSFGAIKKKLVHFPDRLCVGATDKAHQLSSHVISRENCFVRNGEKSTSVKIKKERKQFFSLLAPFAASATQFATVHTWRAFSKCFHNESVEKSKKKHLFLLIQFYRSFYLRARHFAIIALECSGDARWSRARKKLILSHHLFFLPHRTSSPTICYVLSARVAMGLSSLRRIRFFI